MKQNRIRKKRNVYNSKGYKYFFNESRELINYRLEKIQLKKKNYIKYIILLISFILLIIILFSIALIRNHKGNNSNYNNEYEYDDNNIPNIKPDNESIYHEEKFDSYKEACNKAKVFIDKNIKGVLINNEKISATEKPKVSPVVPCRNCIDYILRAIRSIQNQNISDIEIIIINDYSTDNTSLYLEQLQKEDPRIQILNNKKNMGTLYSRSIGTLSAKGKYIFPIDSDDMFLDKDVFSIISSIADKGNFDIVMFDIIISSLLPDVYSTSFWLDLYKKERIPNMVLFQPELGYYPIQLRNETNQLNLVEVLINGKCIKAKVYKTAINKMGEERFSRFMDYSEDIIMNYINFQIAQSMKYVAKFGYIYVRSKGIETRHKMDEAILLTHSIYQLDIFIDLSKNVFKNKKILVHLFNYIIEKNYLQRALNIKEYYYNLFICCIKRLLNTEYITEEDKNEIRKKVKNVNFIKYDF